MHFDIIPFHDEYKISRSGIVIDLNNNELQVSYINGHKCVYLNGIPYRIMELLTKTYITLYDDVVLDYYDKDPENATLNNVYIKINCAHYIDDKTLMLDNHRYLQIQGYPNYFISDNGTVFSVKQAKYCKKHYHVEYPAISLLNKNKKKTITCNIHRLVYCTWHHTPYEDVPVVHHKDSKRYNSNLWNLEKSDMFMNTRYAILDGQKPVQFKLSEIEQMCILYKDGMTYRDISTKLFGNDSKYSEIRNMIYRIKIGMAYIDLREKYNFTPDDIPSKKKLTDDQVHQICKKLELHQSCNSIAKEFHVTPNTIFMIRDRKRWKDISKNYNF